MSTRLRDRLLAFGRTLAAGARDLVYPACCLACGEPLAADRPHFCPGCETDLFDDRYPACPCCAGTIGPFAVVEGRCRACRDESFLFESVVRLGPYEGLRREVILRLKRQTGEGLAELLGECWAARVPARFAASQVDAIVPVPLHWRRRWRRGYNQSAALARGLSLGLRVPCQAAWLRRVRNTPEQTQQTPAGRRANVRGAFAVRPGVPLRGKAVLLVDDVMTTGATAGEAARTLLAAGAARVVVAVLARAQG